MTFNSVMNSLRNGQAAATPDMLGYFSREDQAGDPAEDRSVKREGKTAGQTYTVDSAKTVVWYTFHERHDIDPYDPVEGTSDGADYIFAKTSCTRTVYRVASGDDASDPDKDVVVSSSEVVDWQLPNRVLTQDSGDAVAGDVPLVLDAQLLQMFASSSWETYDLATLKERNSPQNANRW